jgi:hypothetical protein
VSEVPEQAELVPHLQTPPTPIINIKSIKWIQVSELPEQAAFDPHLQTPPVPENYNYKTAF